MAIRTEGVDRPRKTWTSLWAALTGPEKRFAAIKYLASVEAMPMARDSAEVVIARNLRVERAAVRSWSIAKRSDALAGMALLDPPFLAAIIAKFFVSVHGPMVCRFLDLAGVEHKAGAIVPNTATLSRDANRLKTALVSIACDHPRRALALFLDALAGQRLPCFADLGELRQELGLHSTHP